MKWYLSVINNYAQFSGRARRKEYWMFILFNMIISYALQGLVFVFGEEIGVLSTLYSLVVFIPSIAVTVRRLHDTGKSGLYYAGFIALVIVILVAGVVGATSGAAHMDFQNFDIGTLDWFSIVQGMMLYIAIIGVLSIVFFVFMVQDSQPGTNKYGPNPKEEGAEAEEYQLYED